MGKFYFIVNPKAGNGKCMEIWREAEVKLRTQKIPFEVFFTEYPGHAVELSCKAAGLSAGRPSIVAAVGGDGTAHEVLNGLGRSSAISFGFIPGGSGNDFSRGFGLPQNPRDALDRLLAMREEEPSFTDCGRVMMNEGASRLFINNMGAGFDALVSKKANESGMKRLFNKFSLGRLVYVYILLKELFSYRKRTIELTIDGKKHIYEQTWFVTVSNQPFYGGGMIISPAAVPNDGDLDITVVHGLSRPKLLLVFMSVFWGKHIYFKEVHTFRGKEISIDCPVPIDIHTDGEYIGTTIHGRIGIIPEAFRMFSGNKVDKDSGIRGEVNGFR